MITQRPLRIREWGVFTLAIGLLASAQSSEAACLIKTKPTGHPVQSIGVFMLAPENQVAYYESLGFVRTACPKDMSAFRVYVGRICSGSPAGPVPPLDTVALFGQSRKDACASASAGLAEAGG